MFDSITKKNTKSDKQTMNVFAYIGKPEQSDRGPWTCLYFSLQLIIIIIIMDKFLLCHT